MAWLTALYKDGTRQRDFFFFFSSCSDEGGGLCCGELVPIDGVEFRWGLVDDGSFGVHIEMGNGSNLFGICAF